MVMARAVFQPTLAVATQTRFRLRRFQDNAAHLALFERMRQASEHQARSLLQPACLGARVGYSGFALLQETSTSSKELRLFSVHGNT